VDELLALVAEDAEVLGCADELQAIRNIARKGNSADRQREVHRRALESSEDPAHAMRAVVDSLIAETVSGLDV